MELDKTSIVIRERGYLDILDLALRVIRAHARPLLLTMAVGMAPMMLLNTWLLADHAQPDTETGIPFAYMFYALVLVTWEIPLAAAPATVYLGQALFNRQPSWRRILQILGQSLPQLLAYQVVGRGFLVPVALFAPEGFSAIAVLGLLVFWPYLFVRRPYLNEVILLEQNPMRAARRDAMTSLRRSKVLHAGQTDDLIARWLAGTSVGLLLFGCLWAAVWVARAMLLGELESGEWMFTLIFQLVLWAVVGYCTVVRFLSYLDLRIRREGWEVELAMRAEQARLMEHLT